MTFIATTETQVKISAEIGPVRYEAICHFLIDGDYKADGQNDFVGAFADHMHAWSMLVTAEARRLSGSDILDAIADFAARSGDPKLVAQADECITAYRQETERP